MQTKCCLCDQVTQPKGEQKNENNRVQINVWTNLIKRYFGKGIIFLSWNVKWNENHLRVGKHQPITEKTCIM